MSIVPFTCNYVGAAIQNGDALELDAVLTDGFGRPIKPSYSNDDEPGIVHTLVMTWWLQNSDTGENTSYDQTSGVSVVDNDSGHVRLNIPSGVLVSERGYTHQLLGYYDTNTAGNNVLARGQIKTNKPGIASFAVSP